MSPKTAPGEPIFAHGRSEAARTAQVASPALSRVPAETAERLT